MVQDMPTKKRPLLSSYAGVAPPVSPKKRVSTRKTQAWLERAHAFTVRELADTRAELDRVRTQLTEANAKLAAAQARDAEHLIAIRELVDERARDRRADFAEFKYWKDEVERLHHEL